MGKNIHVVPRDDCWAVRRDGNERATSVHATQEEAKKEAIRMAKRERTEVVIHRADGRILERDSYGNEPFPPRTARKVLFPKAYVDRGERESPSQVKK